jgi:hypothetical protein
MIPRLVMIAAVGALFGCGKSSDRPHLTAAAATEIAERKAEESTPNHFADYTPTPAHYDREEDSWSVGYSPKRPGVFPFAHGFIIQVKDKTGEVSLWLP